MLGLRNAPVAQLDRAAASEAVGQKFESSRAHHSSSFSKKNFWSGGTGFRAFLEMFLRGDAGKLRVFGWFFVVSLWCFGGEIVVSRGLFFLA
jgi:hypothetical protein